MYRSVVSFTEETAKELLLKDQKSWQRYVENHIMTIAEKMASNGNICNGQHPSMGKRATHMCISCSGITQSVQRILLPVQSKDTGCDPKTDDQGHIFGEDTCFCKTEG